MKRAERISGLNRMSGAKRRPKAAGWLGIVLLVVNLFLVLAMPPEAMASGNPTDGIEICTPNGMVFIDAAGHRKPAGKQTPGHALCVFCTPMVHAAYTPVLPPQLPLPRFVGLMPAPQALPPTIEGRVSYQSAQPRAPPIV